MKTDTEDPNIATLRDYVRQGSVNGTTEQQDEEALRALQALASTLAERDRRIAELEETLVASHMAYDRLEARLAPPAPAPGELAEGLRKLRELIDKNAEINDSEGQQNRREVTAVCDAAESWQRLQWRPASEAPARVQVLTTRRVVEVTVRMSDGQEYLMTRERKRNKVEVVSRHGGEGAYFYIAKADTFAAYVEHLEEESSKEAALSRARGEGT